MTFETDKLKARIALLESVLAARTDAGGAAKKGYGTNVEAIRSHLVSLRVQLDAATKP